MKIVARLLAIFLITTCACPSIAGSVKKERREEWPLVKNAVAKIGDNQYNLYYDPKNPSHILVYPECWLIRRDEKVVIMPNCTFELVGERLYFDKTWRAPKGYVTGVEWGDPKMSNISFLSTIFRRPKFKNNTVSIWDGDKWIHVIGLPDMPENSR